jgi:hypothetical protein
LLTFAVAGAGLIALTAADWPTYQHDPQRTGAGTETAISVATAPALVKMWAFRTGGPVAAGASVVRGVDLRRLNRW